MSPVNKLVVQESERKLQAPNARTKTSQDRAENETRKPEQAGQVGEARQAGHSKKTRQAGQAQEVSQDGHAGHTGQAGETGQSRDTGQADQTEVEDGGPCKLCCAPVVRPWSVVWRLALCSLAGIVFGWALEKSRVFEPASIRGQMVFTRWIMLKMFLAAMGTAQLVLGILSLLPVGRDRFPQAMESFGHHFAEKGLLTSGLGPFILGCGMTLAGACPGMVLPQVGSWSKNSIYTLLGVLVGAFIYGLVAPPVIRITRPKNPFSVLTIHALFKVRFVVMALPMSIILAVAVFLMEWFIPWQEDLDPVNLNKNSTSNVFLLRSWPPVVGGVLIGSLQVVLVLAVGQMLEGSSSYMTIVSQWVIGDKLEAKFPHLTKYRCGIANWWQVFFVCAAMLGGCLSALTSDSLSDTKGVSIPCAFCGGLLLVMGARLSASCTSGHGVSGAALLYGFSLLAVPCMFAGGISTGYAMQATGALDDYHCHGSRPC